MGFPKSAEIVDALDDVQQTRTKTVAIKLQQAEQKDLVGSIQRYFKENMEEPIGDLKAGMLLDFCLQVIGPAIYNQAIADAQAHMEAKVADLSVECYEESGHYWKKK
ncbi:hypothetical protein CPter291_2363 [Collimonas pratensis]|uniref:DUF2164 domain-containing protein n=1 Tax=Collimonas pratensis TaxID=279113 RepID=A0ABN4MAR8_9BURK|nr:hypothetical protein CPter291_2363 [Collimonas pratensis]